MKIAILGNGGREHAIADQISKSPKLNKLYCLPGNAGTKFIAENVKIDIYDFDKLDIPNSTIHHIKLNSEFFIDDYENDVVTIKNYCD